MAVVDDGNDSPPVYQQQSLQLCGQITATFVSVTADSFKCKNRNRKSPKWDSHVCLCASFAVTFAHFPFHRTETLQTKQLLVQIPTEAEFRSMGARALYEVESKYSDSQHDLCGVRPIDQISQVLCLSLFMCTQL